MPLINFASAQKWNLFMCIFSDEPNCVLIINFKGLQRPYVYRCGHPELVHKAISDSFVVSGSIVLFHGLLGVQMGAVDIRIGGDRK